MKLIRKTRRIFTNNGSGNKISLALFECPFCKKNVEKQLINGLINKSCGCKRRELQRESVVIHGDCINGQIIHLYNIWAGMLSRCKNKNTRAFKYYGGKGIAVCIEWHKYINFKKWALFNGYKENLSIDRINSKDNYCPENCRWIPLGINSSLAGMEKTKLSFIEAEEIRKCYKVGNHTQEQLGKIFNVSDATISRIVRQERCRFKNNKELFDYLERRKSI